MLKGLKRLAGGGLLLLELRGLRQEVAGLKVAMERMASAMELANAKQWPTFEGNESGLPSVEVSYVSDDAQAEMMEIEMRLTAATGHPPTEEEIMAEWDRRRPLR